MLNRHGLVEDSKTVAPDSQFEKGDGPAPEIEQPATRLDHWTVIETRGRLFRSTTTYSRQTLIIPRPRHSSSRSFVQLLAKPGTQIKGATPNHPS